MKYRFIIHFFLVSVETLIIGAAFHFFFHQERMKPSGKATNQEDFGRAKRNQLPSTQLHVIVLFKVTVKKNQPLIEIHHDSDTSLCLIHACEQDLGHSKIRDSRQDQRTKISLYWGLVDLTIKNCTWNHYFYQPNIWPYKSMERKIRGLNSHLHSIVKNILTVNADFAI